MKHRSRSADHRTPSEDVTAVDSAEAVVTECELADSPRKVWKALTVPELLAAWLFPNDIRPEEGARFTFEGNADAHSRGASSRSSESRIDCTILEVRPERLLRYTWRPTPADGGPPTNEPETIVTFELFPTPRGGTRLRVVHSGFAPAAALQTVLTSCGLRPSWSRWSFREAIAVTALRRAA